MSELEDVLKQKFGFDSFKAGQKETIEAVLRNQNTFSVLATGTGKSLCYQLASYLLPGATLVVSPLLSLMEDQIQQLKLNGEKACIAINSHLSFSEKKWALANLAACKFIFFSPETLMQTEVREALQRVNLSLFVVDEAHCISQWGIDFRPEYEQLPQVITESGAPKVLALTATATPQVSRDVEAKLFLKKTVAEVRFSVNRENIAYQVVKTTEKLAYLVSYLEQYQGTGIIYFSSKKEAEQVALTLNQETSRKVAYYHGGLSGQERSLIQQQFINDQLDVLCATSAFGMGIDKGNIRFVIHYHFPASFEAYLQESGRAGRDGQQSHSVILYQVEDQRIHHFLQANLKKEMEQFAPLNMVGFDYQEASSQPLSDLQQKWLAGYSKGAYSFTKLASELQKKQQVKQQQLSKVMEYVSLDSCRRAYLLTYFGESGKRQECYCCDNCGFHANILEYKREKGPDHSNRLINWEEKLKNLFII